MSTILDNLPDIGYEEVTDETTAKREKIDFKMVTFTLAGRHYAINIMKVKEISKANRFTYVPNTPAFVEGVYNLRGEIITIINLRTMFHLPELKREHNELESILILHIQETIIGVIVDTIENVIGVQSRMIQPRHPLFTDIQMKYISGVVDVGGKLYVILDVDRILGEEETAEADLRAPEVTEKEKPAESARKKPGKKDSQDLDFQFISETLGTFAHFYVDEFNAEWVRRRLEEWRKIRTKQGLDVQLTSPSDAQNLLASFYSPSSDMLWNDAYRQEFEHVLWKEALPSVKAWNPGTGRGAEAFSLCSILKLHYPKARIKVWACDQNLLSISAAPTVVYARDTVPEYFIKAGFIKEQATGWQFPSEIKDLVLFEYHNILNGTSLPELDCIVARDLLSFFTTALKQKMIEDFRGKLRTGGILVIGTNERINDPGLKPLCEGNLVAYQKEKE